MRKIDFGQKAKEFSIVLEKFGGMPKASQDQKAYALITYYVKNYPDVPEIRSLIEKYNLLDSKVRRSRDTAKITKDEVISILEKEGKMPSPSKDQILYDKIRNFLKRNATDPDLLKMRYKIADKSCFPLPDSKFGPNPGSQYDPISNIVSREWIEWKNNTSNEYIEYVYTRFGEFPYGNTSPMERLKKNIEVWYRYQREEDRLIIKNLMESLVNLGCVNPWVIQAYNSCRIDTKVLNDNVMKLLVINGACAIHYLAQVAISNCPLPDDFVYWFYYNKLNGETGERGIMPLGSLYSYTGMQPQRVLRVHYREYKKCDIAGIRESARMHYREWKKQKPETITDWLYYGQSELFADDEDFFYTGKLVGADTTLDWGISYIERNMRAGIPYFRFYKNAPKYLDYCLFLLENGYKLDTKDPEYGNLLDLEEDHPLITKFTKEDLMTFKRIKEILRQEYD